MSLWRSTPSRIYYGENRTAVSFDTYVTATAVAAGMLGIAWLCIVPTCKRKRTTFLVNFSYAFAVFVFLLPILGLTCKSWQAGEIFTSTPYSAYSPVEVNGTVGLFVGLTSFNITLLGTPEWQNTTIGDGQAEQAEQINYNELVDFGVRQGRNGFSEYANHVNQEYRRLQTRGVPYPISWVIELFTNDGDGLRWGRAYRSAGYYAHILLWTSIPMWALTLATLAAGLWGIREGFGRSEGTGINGSTDDLLQREFRLKSQLRPTAVLCTATGMLLLCAPIIYAIIIRQYDTPISIHFAFGDLELHFGWTWYLTLLTGAVVTTLGASTYIWCSWKHSERLKLVDYVWTPQVAPSSSPKGYTANSAPTHHSHPHRPSMSHYTTSSVPSGVYLPQKSTAQTASSTTPPNMLTSSEGSTSLDFPLGTQKHSPSFKTPSPASKITRTHGIVHITSPLVHITSPLDTLDSVPVPPADSVALGYLSSPHGARNPLPVVLDTEESLGDATHSASQSPGDPTVSTPAISSTQLEVGQFHSFPPTPMGRDEAAGVTTTPAVMVHLAPPHVRADESSHSSHSRSGSDRSINNDCEASPNFHD